MIIVSLDSLASCVIIGVVLLCLLLTLSLIIFASKGSPQVTIPGGIILLFVLVSFILIIVPIIVLSEASHIYPRMDYGYFANVNNALRHTHALNKPLVMENFSGIYNKKQPTTLIERSGSNQLSYNKPILKIIEPVLPAKQDLEEHRFPQHYEPDTINKRRKQLNSTFHKYYYFDPKIVDATNKFDRYFEKGAIGAHIRFTGHYINKNVDFDSQIKAYTDYIDKSDYPYVFLATHLKDVEDIFRAKYGPRLITHDHYRNPNVSSDWTSNGLDQNVEDTNVLIDMIMLSKCKEIVGGPSNVFYAALWYNPNIKFFIPDILRTAIAG